MTKHHGACVFYKLLFNSGIPLISSVMIIMMIVIMVMIMVPSVSNYTCAKTCGYHRK